MAKQQRMFIVTAVALFMAIAPQSWRFIGRGWGIPAIALAVISIGCVITALRRLVRIGNHLRGSAT